ncbi:signal transduction histidine kinase [Mrakia frigida]|uniref:Ypd1p n=1 Tax=Mrakia frigida TaxID=29902 RepID=UPI003FCBF987
MLWISSIIEADSLLFASSLLPASFSLPNNPTPSQTSSVHEPGYNFSQLAFPSSTHLPSPRSSSLQDTNPIIDMETFNQLQEMDDDEDEREFSRGIIWTYFEQVPEKFDVIGENLTTANYLEVSQVAHFLKGSSAALGVARVTELFEKIQITANEIYKAEKAARLAAATSSTPSFDESNSSSLTPEQTAVLAKAKADALEKEGKKVRSVKRWFEKVKGEYEVAEKWLRGEYAEDEED